MTTESNRGEEVNATMLDSGDAQDDDVAKKKEDGVEDVDKAAFNDAETDSKPHQSALILLPSGSWR